MVVKMIIEKRGLIECIQYEKFASFHKSILHMVTLPYHFYYTPIMATMPGRHLQSAESNYNTVVTGILNCEYGCSEVFPNLQMTSNTIETEEG